MMNISRPMKRLRDKIMLQRKSSPWLYLFQPYQGDEMVALDIETTGLNIKDAEIVSVGAVKIKANQVKTSQKLDLRIATPQHLSNDSIKVHLLRRVDLEDGLALDKALLRLLEFIGNRPLVGYYVHYDLAMLDKFLRPQLGFGIPNAYQDVTNIYRQKLAAKGVSECDMQLSFEAIAKQLAVPVVGRHTALGDAITTALMFVKLPARDY